MPNNPALYCDITDDEIKRRFDALMEVAQGRRAKTDMRSAFRTPLQSIRSAVKNKAKSSLRHGSGHDSMINKKGANNLLNKGVELVVNRSGLGGRVMIYHAFYFPEYGKGAEGKGKLLGLFWWELGTKDGYGRSRKDASTGLYLKSRFHRRTPAKPFFKMAVSSKMSLIDHELAKGIGKVIRREAEKR